jgi:putative cardiolipin synthase
VATPYFIPGTEAMSALAEVRARDVEVTVLTNSLASTDEPLVHFGYSRHRRALLKVGVSLHELIGAAGPHGSPALLGAGSGRGSSPGRLHSKLTVVDGERLFIGSMNMDPRSARFNTEAGLVIRSPALSAELTRLLDGNRRDSSYRVRADASGTGLTWIAGSGHGRRELGVEPGADSRSGLGVRLMAALVDEAML